MCSMKGLIKMEQLQLLYDTLIHVDKKVYICTKVQATVLCSAFLDSIVCRKTEDRVLISDSQYNFYFVANEIEKVFVTSKKESTHICVKMKSNVEVVIVTEI